MSAILRDSCQPSLKRDVTKFRPIRPEERIPLRDGVLRTPSEPWPPDANAAEPTVRPSPPFVSGFLVRLSEPAATFCREPEGLNDCFSFTN
jgi:hypothetical protein